MKRDSQRAKVYRAEQDAFGPARQEEQLTEGGVKDLIRRILESDYVTQRWGTEHEIGLRFWGRDRNVAKVETWHDTIVLPRWARNPFVVCHEVAHYLTMHNNRFDDYFEDVAPHGPEFARCYRMCIEIAVGTMDAYDLEGAYMRHGVKEHWHGVAERIRPTKALTGVID